MKYEYETREEPKFSIIFQTSLLGHSFFSDNIDPNEIHTILVDAGDKIQEIVRARAQKYKS